MWRGQKSFRRNKCLKKVLKFKELVSKGVQRFKTRTSVLKKYSFWGISMFWGQKGFKKERIGIKVRRTKKE